MNMQYKPFGDGADFFKSFGIKTQFYAKTGPSPQNGVYKYSF